MLASMLALTACQSTSGATTITTAAETEETSEGAQAETTAAETTAAEETVSSEAAAADWKPDKPLTLIVAYKEGSSTDMGARLLAHYAEKYTGQPIEIKNIPANSGMTGWETLAGSPADGSTLGFINMPNIFTAMDNGGKFTIQDFTPVCNHLIETSVVVVADSSPYQTIDDLIEANKAAEASGELLCASTNGVQASNDIGAALLAYNSGGWSFKHIAYGSTNDQLKALLSGECDWSVAKTSDVKQYLNPEVVVDDAPVASLEAAAETDAETTAVETTAETAATTAAETVAEATKAVQTAEATKAAQTLATETAPAETKPVKTPDEKLRVLAIFATERDQSLTSIPTLQECGYPTGWYGSTRSIVAPKNTDPTIVNFYAEAFKSAMEDPECIAAHEAEGLDLSYMDGNALAERIDDRFRFNSTLLPKLFTK